MVVVVCLTSVSCAASEIDLGRIHSHVARGRRRGAGDVQIAARIDGEVAARLKARALRAGLHIAGGGLRVLPGELTLAVPLPAPAAAKMPQFSSIWEW